MLIFLFIKGNQKTETMSAPQSTFWNIDRIMKLIIAPGIITGLIFLMSYLKNVLIPFFVACFIAYLLQPIVEFNRRWTHEKGRIISSILTVLEVILLLGGIVYMFLPHVMDELQELGKILHEINVGKRQLPPEFAGIDRLSGCLQRSGDRTDYDYTRFA